MTSSKLKMLCELAYREAKKAKGKHKHAAIILANGKILAKACNNYDNERHAEVRALKRVPHEVKDLIDEIVVVRIRKSQRFGMSKPCKECQEAIKEANIKVVYYTTNEETIEREI